MAKKIEEKKEIKSSWLGSKVESKPEKKEGYSQEKADEDLKSHPKFKKFHKGEK